MTHPVPSQRRAAVLIAATLLTAAAGTARAEDASPWIADSHSAVRLLAGSRSGAMLLGGIAMTLQPGWKTYWRTPGDSGVPPRFDFSKSDNVDSVTVLWPAPTSFDDGAGGQSLGYKTEVILPLRIVAKAADRPVTLRAAISYAVCEKICIPVDAVSELTFSSVASTRDGALYAALDAVPKPALVGDDVAPGIRGVRRDGNTVIVDIAAPDAAAVALFAEGPTPDWALPVPRETGGAPGGMRRFTFALEGVPNDAAIKGAALKLTLAGERAYEYAVTLD